MARDYCIVILAFNEESSIESALQGVFSNARGRDFEILLATDGSTDGTLEKARELTKKFPRTRIIHSKRRLWRGGAIENAFRNTRAKIVAFLDADSSVDMSCLNKLLEEAERNDFVIGSRYAAGARAQRTFHRLLASLAYNALIRALFGTGVLDHQCGFKAFKRARIMEVAELTDSKHWFWDSEVIIRARSKGYTIKEVPVDWCEARNARESKLQFFRDSAGLFLSAARMRLQAWREGIA